ncbi:MAG: succinylglutamate desuccinylase [Oligoflexia bacterium]|nr:succinylglutamate desuccinylase [Oligoflexia bacterium]
MKSIKEKGILNYLLNNSFEADQVLNELTEFKTFTVKTLYPGIFEINPKTQGDCLLESYAFSCGIHGNETAPIEIVSDILDDIFNERMEVKSRMLFIYGNIEAMKESKRELYFNMNRMFSGNHQTLDEKEWETKRSVVIENVLKDFFQNQGTGWHFDLHTAIRKSMIKRFAVAPMKGTDYSNEEKNVLKNFGIEAVLYMQSKATTLSYYSVNECQANAFTLELGKVEKFGNNKREDFKRAEEAIRKIVCGNFKELFRDESSELKEFVVKNELLKDHDQYQLLIENNTPNFTSYPKGSVIHKSPLGDYLTTGEEFIVFPNQNVPVGQRTGLMLQLKV